MDKLGDTLITIFVLALICSPFIMRHYRAWKKRREAADRLKELEAYQEKIRLEREQREMERQKERERREAERQKDWEEAARIRMETLGTAYAEYDRIMDPLETYPISVSDIRAEKLDVSAVDELTYSTITKKTDRNKLGNFIVVDTETTGLNYSSNEIIDIAAIRFRGFQPTAKFSALLSPTKGAIPESATRVNHITDEMVAGKPCFQEIAESFLAFIGNDNLVGHNLPFDLKFIVHYGANVTKTKRRYFDTLALAKRTIPKRRMLWDKDLMCYVEDWNTEGVMDYKLDTLRSYFSIVTKGSHRAEADAMATGALFKILSDMRR